MPYIFKCPPSDPLLPTLTQSATFSLEVGSPTRQKSIISLSCIILSIILSINPSLDVPSSFEVSNIASLKLSFSSEFRNSLTDSMKAATGAFISAVPLPYKRSPSIVAEKGGYFHLSSGPLGTTSVCPKKQNNFPDVPIVAYKFSIF